MRSIQHKVRVLMAKSGQADLSANSRHCSADANGLRAFDVELGDQIRLIRSPSAYALYTVTKEPHETSDNVLRMGLTGRQRLGVSDSFDGALDAEITRSSLNDLEAESMGELVERLDEPDCTHDRLLVCAPHGGMIEAHTAEQAERVYALLREAGKGVSCWRCKGWGTVGGGLRALAHPEHRDLPAKLPSARSDPAAALPIRCGLPRV